MLWNLENGEFLSLFLYREGGVRVEDDGGPGGLCVELPLLWDPWCLSSWSRTDGEDEDNVLFECKPAEDLVQMNDQLRV